VTRHPLLKALPLLGPEGRSALLKSHRGSAAVRALKWLLAARDPHGTWSSTQATVLALRALLEAAGQSELSEAQGTLRVVGARGVKEVHFAPGQADVVQRVDLTDWLDAAGTALHFEGDAPEPATDDLEKLVATTPAAHLLSFS